MFNWNCIDRYFLIDYLLQVETKIVKKNLTIDQFHKILTTHIKKLIPVKCKKNYNPSVKSNTIHVGGNYYYLLDEQHKKSIQLEFHYSTKNNYINFSSNKFYYNCYLITNVILHEIIHMKQFRSRRFKLTKEYKSKSKNLALKDKQEYLGHVDEIDAWAFVIACELNDTIGDHEKIINLVSKLKYSTKKSYTLDLYLKTFRNDTSVIEKLKKKIINYVPSANRGKPFRYSSFIAE